MYLPRCLAVAVLTCFFTFFPTIEKNFAVQSETTTYFVDAEKGDDSNSGTEAKPCRSLQKALSLCKGGERVMLNSGDYGYLRQGDVPPKFNQPVMVAAAEGQTPVLEGISLQYSTLTNVNMILKGLTIKPKWVDPGADPQMPNTRGNTYKKTSGALSLKNAAHFTFSSGKIIGTNKYLTPYGVQIYDCKDVLIFRTEITKVSTGMNIGCTESVTIRGNYIHELISSGIRALPNNAKLLIVGNHIHNSRYSPKDDYAPRAQGQNPHASAVSIRTGDLRIAGNVFHDIGTSSGMMFYEPDGAFGKNPPKDFSYDNIIIENNLLFDIPNTSILRMYNAGKNILIRNNTFIGKHRDVNTAQYKLNTALLVHNLAKGTDGSSISIYNNILLGVVGVPQTSPFESNMVWSMGYVGQRGFLKKAPKGNVLLCKSANTTLSVLDDLFVEKPNFTPGHGQFMDFHLKSGSPAINFGMTSKQTPRGLGLIIKEGPLKGFLNLDGLERSAEHHSAGCYELGVPATQPESEPAKF